MISEKKQKRRVVVSYKNLSAELREEVRKKYPFGYTDHMIRIDKGPGDFFYAIVLETEDTSYLIKVDVKVTIKSKRRKTRISSAMRKSRTTKVSWKAT